jgi:hypothetical protein
MRAAHLSYIPSCLCLVCFSCACLHAHPSGEDLLTHFYRDNGSDLLTGQANVVVKTNHPVANKDTFYPNYANSTALEKQKADNYFRYLRERYDVKFTPDKIDRSYQAMRVYYDGDKKRKDVAYLNEAGYKTLRANPQEFTHQDFAEVHYQNDRKMISISEVGESDKMHPQANISFHTLGIPKLSKFGRARTDEKASAHMLEQLTSDRYVISTAETDDGLLVIAQSQEGFLTRMEVLFDPDNDYAVKRCASFGRGVLFEEKIYSDYITTSSGTRIPTNIIIRKFAPAAGENGKPYMSFEEETTVFFADYNVDLPDATFVPNFPPGTTVYDETVSPPVQFVTSDVPFVDEATSVAASGRSTSEESSSPSRSTSDPVSAGPSVNDSEREANTGLLGVSNNIVSPNATLSPFERHGTLLIAGLACLVGFAVAGVLYLKRTHAVCD